MRLFVFAHRELAASFAAAQRLVACTRDLRIEAKLIDKTCTDLDALTLVAAYGVVEPVATILVDKTIIRTRLARVPSIDELKDILLLLTAK